MKATGVYWLPEIPASWEMRGAWSLFSESEEIADEAAPVLTPSKEFGVVTRDRYVELSGARPQQNFATTHLMRAVRPGQFIITMGSFESGLEYSEISGKITPHYRVLDPAPECDHGYFRWLFKSAPFIDGLSGLATEIRKGQEINYTKFSRLKLPLPPLNQQRGIADYLDGEVAEMDAMNADLDKLVETLIDRRSRVVMQAVHLHTSSAELPPGWTRVPFKYAIETRFTGEWGSEPGGDELDVPCVRVADFDRARRIAGEGEIPTIRSISRAKAEAKALRTHDLLLERSGGSEKKPVGNVVLYLGPDDYICANFVEAIRLHDDQDPAFWCYVQEAAYATGFTHVHVRQTSGIQNLDAQGFYSEAFAVPPLDEQRRIVAELDAATARIDAMISGAERLKALLAERRSTLITEVVTGRKEVPAA